MKTRISCLAFFLSSVCAFLATGQTGINQKLISDFRQTVVAVSQDFQTCTKDYKLGNCATIALIKCALAQFGTLENIYKSIQYNPDGSIDIVFNDNVKVAIAKQEQDTVKLLAGIKPKENAEYFDKAIILYTSICKRVLTNKNNYDSPQCINSFTNAVELINSGYTTNATPGLLGFTSSDVKDNILQQPAAIIWCSAHAAYCSNGLQDLVGSTYQISSKKMRNLSHKRKIKGAIVLVK